MICNGRGGCTLQTGVKFVALFQIVCSSLLVLVVGYALVQQGTKVIDDSNSSRTEPKIVSSVQNNFTLLPENNAIVRAGPISQTTLRIFVAYLIIFVTLGIFLLVDVQLWKGASQRIAGKCSTWCTVRYVRSTFAGIIFIAGFYKVQIEPLQSFVGVEIICNLCCILIVQKFMKELKLDEGDKDWRQSSITSNGSTSSDSPWFTTATTPTATEDEDKNVHCSDEEGNIDKEKKSCRNSGKEKSVTFAL